MNFIDWTEAVLRKFVELGQSDLDAQTYGIDDIMLITALFGADTEPIGDRRVCLYSAISELKTLGWIREVGEGNAIWEVTESGTKHSKFPRQFWRDICETELPMAEPRALLEAINQHSPQSTDDYAWLEEIEYETLRDTPGMEWDWATFRTVAFRLVDLGFVKGDFYQQSASLRATYRGLVWKTRCVRSNLFISYQRAPSEAYALLLSEKLRPYGMTVFVDTLTVEGAELFPDRLEQAITDCDIFVCLLGSTTLQSEWVQREIQRADELGKRMIPVFQPDFTMPNLDGLPAPVASLLAYEGVKVNSGYIAAAIDKLASMIEETWFNQFSR